MSRPLTHIGIRAYSQVFWVLNVQGSCTNERTKFIRTSHSGKACGRLALMMLAAVMSIVMAAPVNAAPSAAPLFPGDQVFVVHSDATVSTCTVGPYVSFTGNDGSSRYGAVTAGHCGDDGDDVYRVRSDGSRELISKIFGAVNDKTSLDYALLPLDRAYISQGGPYTPHGVMLTQELAAASFRGSNVSVCAAGITTGTRCGPLVEVVGGRIHARFPSDHGDSGGPVWVNTANGTEVVGILRGNLLADPSVSVIIPIGVPLNAYGVKLVVAAR